MKVLNKRIKTTLGTFDSYLAAGTHLNLQRMTMAVVRDTSDVL